MATFELKTDLPVGTQKKIDYLESIPSAQRTVSQAAFLTSLTPYLTNAVLSVSASGLITAASGLTVPTGYAGFAKNATFVKTDASGNGLYTNTGSVTVASWDLVDQASTSNITDKAVTSEKLADEISFDGKTLLLDEVTPVNAGASSSLLTVAGKPSEADTVSLGGKTYKFRAVIGEGVAATGTITTDETLVANGATVLIGTTTYTYKTALTAEPVAYEVLIGGNYTDMLNNLAAAINGGVGEGTAYSTGTVAHPLVTAGAVHNGAFTVTASSVGFAGNIDVTSSDAHLYWGAGTLIGGIDAAVANDVLIGESAETAIDNLVLAITAGEGGAGTNYATGTTVNALATAVKASASTMTATNKIKGVIGDNTAIAASGADLSWAEDATELSGGENGTVGVKNQIVADDTNLYMCTATNTIADANWKKLVLQSI